MAEPMVLSQTERGRFQTNLLNAGVKDLPRDFVVEANSELAGRTRMASYDIKDKDGKVIAQYTVHRDGAGANITYTDGSNHQHMARIDGSNGRMSHYVDGQEAPAPTRGNLAGPAVAPQQPAAAPGTAPAANGAQQGNTDRAFGTIADNLITSLKNNSDVKAHDIKITPQNETALREAIIKAGREESRQPGWANKSPQEQADAIIGRIERNEGGRYNDAKAAIDQISTSGDLSSRMASGTVREKLVAGARTELGTQIASNREQLTAAMASPAPAGPAGVQGVGGPRTEAEMLAALRTELDNQSPAPAAAATRANPPLAISLAPEPPPSNISIPDPAQIVTAGQRLVGHAQTMFQHIDNPDINKAMQQAFGAVPDLKKLGDDALAKVMAGIKEAVKGISASGITVDGETFANGLVTGEKPKLAKETDKLAADIQAAASTGVVRS